MTNTLDRARSIALDMLNSFPNDLTPSRKSLLDTLQPNQAPDLLALLSYLFNKYPYAEMDGDDEVITDLRRQVRTNTYK